MEFSIIFLGLVSKWFHTTPAEDIRMENIHFESVSFEP